MDMPGSCAILLRNKNAQKIHGTGIFSYIYPGKTKTIHVAKYTSPMDGMGYVFPQS